ncbi:hypothetical protein MMC20_004995 [Loxospora ochrophaea]|nr:hypothetical protein [Loxospora ochrophaea]
MGGSEDEDEVPQLSSDTMAALQEFYIDRDTREQKFEDLKASAEKLSGKPFSMEMFTEDWNASQFWYSDETSSALAKQLLDGATSETTIAVVSAPSVFIAIKNLLSSEDSTASPQVCLLEFDERFAALDNFVRYDFRSPFKLPRKDDFLRG